MFGEEGEELELDSSQKNFLENAPADGAVLCFGPPGTGKSLLAIQRAIDLSESQSDTKVIVLMYSQVLAQFSRQMLPEYISKDFEKVSVTTLLSWLERWYESTFSHKVPKLNSDIYQPDWSRMIRTLFETKADGSIEKFDPIHLIIDEGQDFPPEMYQFFRYLIDFCGQERSQFSLTVFADANQSMTKYRSSIEDMMEQLNTRKRNKRLWTLTKNYRNTREIYQLARYFQASGTASTANPHRESNRRPIVFFREQQKDLAEFICRFCVQGKQSNSGVISFGKKSHVKTWIRLLKTEMAKYDGSYLVQGYVSQDEEYGNARSLRFNRSNVMTVLHHQSAKGLEFDSVFVVDLDRYGEIFDHEVTDLAKKLYVTCSRPKNFLFFGVDARNQQLPPFLKLLPATESEFLDYQVQNHQNGWLDLQLDSFDWNELTNPQVRWYHAARHLAGRLQKKSVEEAQRLLHQSLHKFDEELFSSSVSRQLIVDEQALVSFLIDIGPDRCERISGLMNQETT